MKVKVKNIAINGIRGVKDSLLLNLNEKSILLFGENGSGKSSISDSLEWFYTDKVSHLSSKEIELKEALRNSFIDDSIPSSVHFSFNKSQFDGERTLFSKRGKLLSEFSNTSDEFKLYHSLSENENLLLCYQDLRNFVDQTKTDKLTYLSDIIGFAQVTKTKDVLKKTFNFLKNEIKGQNFEKEINAQKQILISKIGATISLESQLFESINTLIKRLNIGIEVKSMSDIDRVLNHIKTPANNKLVDEVKFLEKINTALLTLKSEVDFIDKEYQNYILEFEKLASDVNSIMQTYLEELLKVAQTVITKKYHTADTCPLCQQPKKLEDLKTEIQKRLEEIELSSEKKSAFSNAQQIIGNISKERFQRIEISCDSPFINESEYLFLKEPIEKLKKKIAEYQNAAKEKVTSGNKLVAATNLKLINSDFEIQDTITEKIEALNAKLKKDNIAEIFANISAAKDAFLSIRRINKEKESLDIQINSLEIIFNEFVKKQKEGLDDFITSFSGKINEYYQYMNPAEQFQDIKIVTIGDDDELNGITIEFKFNGNWFSPPQKYFSESHLNCIGISFFLASVIAFNKINEFFILDDVISSFDTNHRKRFADLVFEKFSNYQIILLTHEEEWFSYIRQLAKKRSWAINEIKWTEDRGTYLEESPGDLKKLIETSIANNSIEFLGNPIRKYLEQKLKDICLNLDVKVSFKFNDVNEKRMPDELLNDLKAKINKYSSELKAKMPVVDRVMDSSLLGNLLSHDNPFNPKMGDLKSFWDDVIQFEKIFYCQESTCKKPKVSLKNYDNVAKAIRCGCGVTKYEWNS